MSLLDNKSIDDEKNKIYLNGMDVWCDNKNNDPIDMNRKLDGLIGELFQ